MRNIKRDVKAISPVLAVLMMIAVAIAGSLITYAWVMGYIGFTTEKSGQAIMIQSIAYDGGTGLTVWVQNVGEGTVVLQDNNCLYVDGTLMNSVGDTLLETETAQLDTTIASLAGGQKITVKVVSSLGTFTETDYYNPV
jgi:flagellin-like protein